MAKAPEVGSKINVAAYIHKKLEKYDKRYKVIQPQVIAHFNETFWWVAKIIKIDDSIGSVGIIKKYETGFAVVSEHKKKLKTELFVLDKEMIKGEKK
jgi:hypothetical protein